MEDSDFGFGVFCHAQILELKLIPQLVENRV
jgi:hypothetical protein